LSTLRPCRQLVLVAACSLICLTLWASSAQADLLGFQHDFFTDQSSVNYDAHSGSLTVTGYPETFDLDGAPPPDYNIIASPSDPDYGTYNIDVLVNPTTGVPISGTLTITGALADDAFNPVSLPGLGSSNTLLQANILSISSAGSGELRLTFGGLSGDVVPSYFPLQQAFVQLHSAGSPAGDWYSESFSKRPARRMFRYVCVWQSRSRALYGKPLVVVLRLLFAGACLSPLAESAPDLS